MSKRKSMKTTKKEIVDHWTNVIYEGELNFDWSEAEIMCWNCGCERDTEKCHIVPHALGGKDSPDNYVLMCNECHQMAPNCNSTSFMWDWIKSNRTSMGIYETYWWEKAFQDYKNIYKIDYIEELKNLNLNDPLVFIKENQEWSKKNKDYYTVHFGKNVNQSTRIGVLRGFVEYVKKKYEK